MKLNGEALATAARKLRKLRLEYVYDRKEKSAETVARMFDRGYQGAGSQEAMEYILRHGVKYYLEALAKTE